MKRPDVRALIAAAARARERAYAPYSRYKVGAAVLSNDGRVFSGCNVENASYGLTICAERAAIARAVAEGARKIAAVALVTGGKIPASPCGACRQVIAEFGPQALVVMAAGNRVKKAKVAKLLPDGFAFAKK